MRCRHNDAVNEQGQSAAEKIYSCLELDGFYGSVIFPHSLLKA